MIEITHVAFALLCWVMLRRFWCWIRLDQWL